MCRIKNKPNGKMVILSLTQGILLWGIVKWGLTGIKRCALSIAMNNGGYGHLGNLLFDWHIQLYATWKPQKRNIHSQMEHTPPAHHTVCFYYLHAISTLHFFSHLYILIYSFKILIYKNSEIIFTFFVIKWQITCFFVYLIKLKMLFLDHSTYFYNIN